MCLPDTYHKMYVNIDTALSVSLHCALKAGCLSLNRKRSRPKKGYKSDQSTPGANLFLETSIKDDRQWGWLQPVVKLVGSDTLWKEHFGRWRHINDCHQGFSLEEKLADIATLSHTDLCISLKCPWPIHFTALLQLMLCLWNEILCLRVIILIIFFKWKEVFSH